MAAPYLALSEPLSEEKAPYSGCYNRKALLLLALLSGFGGVALWNQLAGSEQQLSTVDMSSAFTRQTMQHPGAQMPMQRPWNPMQSAPVSQPTWQTNAEPVRAEAAVKPKPKPKPKPTPVPFSKDEWLATLEEQLKAPEKIMIKFGGGTGGMLRKAQVEEMYIMTWNNPGKETIFEMPTGGAAIMNAGQNMIFLARKEHGIALGTKFRNSFKIKDYRIFRRFPDGVIQFIHPADGVFPEKVNAGRKGVNQLNGNLLANSKGQPKFTPMSKFKGGVDGAGIAGQ